jgi:hypothetical protein
MSFNRNKEQLRKFIRAFYLQHHRLPIGDLNVPDIGVVAFSAPPKADLENIRLRQRLS